MSMGFLLPPAPPSADGIEGSNADTPVVWRGMMVMKVSVPARPSNLGASDDNADAIFLFCARPCNNYCSTWTGVRARAAERTWMCW